MTVIPVINCRDEKCVAERVSIFKKLGSDKIKFDISDGKFNPVVTWNEPEKLASEFDLNLSDLESEVHLMLEEPEDDVRRWLEAGVKRIILHIEADFDFDDILDMCDEAGAELMLSIKLSSSWKELEPYLDRVSHVQFLAVKPGFSGQEMHDSILDAVKTLRESYPNVKIEIDGGINEKTAKKVKEAGADIIVSSSFIFGAENPKEAYKKLKSI